jgi:hypothetical protein
MRLAGLPPKPRSRRLGIGISSAVVNVDGTRHAIASAIAAVVVVSVDGMTSRPNRRHARAIAAPSRMSFARSGDPWIARRSEPNMAVP